MKMEKLTILEKNNDLLQLLIRVGDLFYFEGPILSLYENAKTGHLFLLDWVDRDKENNRWIIYRVDPVYLMKFLNRKISHLDLYNNRPKVNVYVVDISSKGRLLNSDLKELYTIPKNYLPNSENYFDKEDSVLYERIIGRLNRVLSQTKSQNEFKEDNLKNDKEKYVYKSQAISSNYMQGSMRIFTVIGKYNVGTYDLDSIVSLNHVKIKNSNYGIYKPSTNTRRLNTLKHRNA